MVYDPAWDMPQLNWQQQGSFEGGSIPPIIEPDAGTQILLGPVAQEWMPWICGALDQLRNPSAWIVADDTAMYNTLRRVDTLLGLICGNRGSCVPTQTRFMGCVLQTSIDGGTTWVDVPGWASSFGDCVRAALPPPPPNIGPTPIQQRACNIAGYLASEIIEKGLTAGMTDWVMGQQALAFAANISQAVLADALPLANLFVQAANDVFSYVSSITISDLRTAMADPTLWSEVTCAIYNAIHVDGAVTDANYPAIVANVCAISYSPSVAINAVCAFVTGIGSVNLRHWQVTGALDNVDCLGCGPWCNEEDFRDTPGAYVLTGLGGGVYSAGSGWETTTFGVTGSSTVQIVAGPGTPANPTSFDIYVASTANTIFPGARAIAFFNGGALVGSVVLPDTAYASLTKIITPLSGVTIDKYEIGWAADGPTGAGVIQANQIKGAAPAPALLNPCVLP